MTRRIAVVAILLLFCLTAQAAVTVILTRHAEKAAEPASDPALTPSGVARAQLLASMLGKSGITEIYVTELARTQQTVAPLAMVTHINPTKIAANDTAGLVKAIRRHKDGVLVVVGHTNTLPEIIAKLGGPAVTIADDDYDSLFVVTIHGKAASLLRMRYR